MKITFFGGAQKVTGSKYLIETGDYKLLLDCGLHQGRRSESNALNKGLPFDASTIDAVILSHAHADHCGMLPVLVRDGFLGKIYCTAPTADIAKFILEDSANVQKNDAIYLNKHLLRGQPRIEPLYTERDVKKTFGHFNSVPYFRLSNKWTALNENIHFKFYDAGHILGSAITLLKIKEPARSATNVAGGEDKTTNLVFTGDLGRHFLPILRDPEYIKENAEVLITEATYGARLHEPVLNLEEKLKHIINDAITKKSKIIVPSFSLGRTQELIYILHNMIDNKIIESLPIYVDSPLSQKITRVFNTYTSDFDEQFWEDFGEEGDKPFMAENLFIVNSIEESKKINDQHGPFIVIAGSGMAEGGRVLHHLKNNIEDPNNIILITGYQAENTLGRKIRDGISPVKILGQEYNLKAKVITLNELSAHADQRDLLNYIENIKGLNKIFLIHSEITQSEPLKKIIEEKYPSMSVKIPNFKEEFEV